MEARRETRLEIAGAELMRKTVIVSIAGVVLLVVGVSLILLRAWNQIFALPANSPVTCKGKAPPGVKTVVLLGDSLTHGTVSQNYVSLLEARFRGRPLRFINAGVNSHLAYNLHERMDGILGCRPDFAVVLVGTNDVNALVSEEKMQSYMQDQKLPRRPDAVFFRRQLASIVRRLQTESSAQVALLSLPPIGEDLLSAANKNVIEYSNIVAHVARTHNVAYLPLREAAWQVLASRPASSGRPRDCGGGRYPIASAALRHYLLAQSWDAISAKHGFVLLTDCLHLNARGATLVADLVAGFIEGGGRQPK